MKGVWDAIKNGYLRIIDPVVDLLVRLHVSPNAITTIGTASTVIGGAIFATGHIMLAAWWVGLTAIFDVLDGTVARRTGRSTTFGAFYDSTLDRVADGALLGGLAIFFARRDVFARGGELSAIPSWAGTPMVAITLLGIIGTYLTSYTRARAEALGIPMKGVGFLERPERIVLIVVPQAFFGLAFDGYLLMLIVTLLTASAWLTAVQRILHVYRVTREADRARVAEASEHTAGAPGARHSGEGAAPVRRATAPHPALKGD
jgi:CDP-diacylglycerol---glycerol-3-phosphate 3-phosphatidyltransferase